MVDQWLNLFSDNRNCYHDAIEKYVEEGGLVLEIGVFKNWKGTIIRRQALGKHTEVEEFKKELCKYFDEVIIKNYDERYLFEDINKNLESFLGSSYMKGFYALGYLDVWYRSDSKYCKYFRLPYLFLEKIKKNLEFALVYYISYSKNFGELEEDAYLKLLYSAAIYEIFLKQSYFLGVKIDIEGERAKRIQEYEEKDRLEINRVRMQRSKMEGRAPMHTNELFELYSECCSELYEADFLVRYIKYYIHLQNTLYTVLRILYLISYIKENQTHAVAPTKDGKRAHKEAVYWKKLWLDDLFEDAGNSEPCEDETLKCEEIYKHFNRIFYEYDVFPSCENDETFEEFKKKTSGIRSNLQKYIERLEMGLAGTADSQVDSWRLEFEKETAKQMREVGNKLLNFPD